MEAFKLKHRQRLFILPQILLGVIALCLFLSLTGCYSYVDVNPSLPPITKKPKRVSLLLPLQGEWSAIGEAVKNGFIEANQMAGSPVVVDVLDTQRINSMPLAHKRGAQLGADLVVGPLLQSDVQTLSQFLAMKVPVLTLNYLDTQITAPSNFYQFGLSPIDEIKQLVKHAKRNDHQSALIMVPDNTWGKKVSQAFTLYWEEQGGTVVDCLHYSDELPLLDKQIRSFLRFKLPQQRRDDFDVIFLGAPSELGRHINPLLAFYFSANVPVYATASIYDTGVPDYLNRDLDKINICDTFWSLGHYKIKSSLSNQFMSRYANSFQHYSRYYALGVDAFDIAMQLYQLDLDDTQIVKGASGQLSLDKNRCIIRVSPLAQFKKSKPHLLSTLEE